MRVKRDMKNRQIKLLKGKAVRTLIAPSEAEIQATICQWLDLMKLPYSVTDASIVIAKDGKPRRKVKTGWPDITSCIPGGRLWAIECKTLKGNLRDSQIAILKQLAEIGALVTIARCLEDVMTDYKIAVSGS